MSAQADAPITTVLAVPAVGESVLTNEDGVIAGLLGAAAVALWFFIVDAICQRPLYTPTLLGTALFRRVDSPWVLKTLPVSLEIVAMYTAAHGLVFAAIGGVTARLLSIAQRHPEVGFGILILFVVFEFGVTVSPVLLAPAVVSVLGWPALFVANVLATAVMSGYLWSRHPGLAID